MEITFAPKGIVQIDDCRIIYRNLSGVASKFNREGDRNFAILITDPAQADALMQEGWNVKVKPPREEGEEPFMYLPVKVKFTDYGPNVYIESARTMTKLNPDTIGDVDDIDILSVNLDIRPYDWEVNGKTGRTAYLQTMNVIQKVNRDRFSSLYESKNGIE